MNDTIFRSRYAAIKVIHLTTLVHIQNFRDDRLYIDANGTYYATCVHGGKHGGISIQDSKADSMYNSDNKPTTATRIRKDIENFYNFTIPADAPLYIFPCYPNAVRREKGKALAFRKVGIIGEWPEATAVEFNEHDVVLYPTRAPRTLAAFMAMIFG